MWNTARKIGRFGKQLVLALPVVLMLGGGAGATLVPVVVGSPMQSVSSPVLQTIGPDLYWLGQDGAGFLNMPLHKGIYKIQAVCLGECAEQRAEVWRSVLLNNAGQVQGERVTWMLPSAAAIWSEQEACLPYSLLWSLRPC